MTFHLGMNTNALYILGVAPVVPLSVSFRTVEHHHAGHIVHHLGWWRWVILTFLHTHIPFYLNPSSSSYWPLQWEACPGWPCCPCPCTHTPSPASESLSAPRLSRRARNHPWEKFVISSERNRLEKLFQDTQNCNNNKKRHFQSARNKTPKTTVCTPGIWGEYWPCEAFHLPKPSRSLDRPLSEGPLLHPLPHPLCPGTGTLRCVFVGQVHEFGWLVCWLDT